MFFKEEDSLLTDERHWDIYDISNGLKCVHSSGEYEEYFEYDEIDAKNAFDGSSPMSVLDLFSRMIFITPKTKGFAYNDFNLIAKIDKHLQKPKGFIIRPRLLDANSDIDNKIPHIKESYASIETLRATNVRDFVNIILLPNSHNDKLQQILDSKN